MHIERYCPGLELFRLITLFILQLQPIVEGYLQYHNSSFIVPCHIKGLFSFSCTCPVNFYFDWLPDSALNISRQRNPVVSIGEVELKIKRDLKNLKLKFDCNLSATGLYCTIQTWETRLAIRHFPLMTFDNQSIS